MYTLTRLLSLIVAIGLLLLRAAGRWDLHHAIKYQGGYQEVGQSLGRVSAWPRNTELLDPRTLAAELRAFQREQDDDEGCMPSARALLDADRPELLQACACATCS